MKLIIMSSSNPEVEHENINSEYTNPTISNEEECYFYLAKHVKNVLDSIMKLPKCDDKINNVKQNVINDYIMNGAALKDIFDLMMSEYINENCDDCEDCDCEGDCEDCDCEDCSCNECDECSEFQSDPEEEQYMRDDEGYKSCDNCPEYAYCYGLNDNDDATCIEEDLFELVSIFKDTFNDDINPGSEITLHMNYDEYSHIKNILDHYIIEDKE